MANSKNLGTASLLAQTSELFGIENEYGTDVTAHLMRKGFSRKGIDLSIEEGKGFLKVAHTFLESDVNIGYLLKEEEDKAMKATQEILNMALHKEQHEIV